METSTEKEKLWRCLTYLITVFVAFLTKLVPCWKVFFHKRFIKGNFLLNMYEKLSFYDKFCNVLVGKSPSLIVSHVTINILDDNRLISSATFIIWLSAIKVDVITS